MNHSFKESLRQRLAGGVYRWLVTGAAGFIGSNLVEALLELDQEVCGFDNFATGFKKNLDDVRTKVGNKRSDRFSFVEGSILDAGACRQACEGANYVLHQAALGSVPRSIERPADTHQANTTGFLNMFLAARDAKVTRFVYASSSSVYGDDPNLPKVEDRVGKVLSPYAASKAVGELYGDVYSRVYGLPTVGLRYFNVFGPRQNPDGAYAAVVPKWIAALRDGKKVTIHGDGSTSRDFCYVANVIQANVLAAISSDVKGPARVYNIAVHQTTSLNDLFSLIRGLLEEFGTKISHPNPDYGPFRPGDIQHSLANISRAKEELGYEPTHSVSDGLREALPWYLS